MLEEGSDYPDSDTEYVTAGVDVAEEHEVNELKQKKLFYDVNNVNRNTGK